MSGVSELSSKASNSSKHRMQSLSLLVLTLFNSFTDNMQSLWLGSHSGTY